MGRQPHVRLVTFNNDLLVYSFKAYDIFGNAYEPVHDATFFNFDMSKMAVDSISDKTYNGGAVTISGSDIRFRYGDFFKGEDALTAEDLDSIGVGCEVMSYSNNTGIGTASAVVRLFEKVIMLSDGNCRRVHSR
ncbi:MAG: hypothetical protein K6B14_11100 [Lachnospiraceae bacterium]|nr:hypothetical protein [Lachnospiraceae bacterium]